MHGINKHATKAIRKLLHHRCNLLVGFFEKDPDIVLKIIDYLEMYNGRKS